MYSTLTFVVERLLLPSCIPQISVGYLIDLVNVVLYTVLKVVFNTISTQSDPLDINPKILGEG